MSETKEQEKGERGPLSRREFFEETAVKGGAVLAGTAVTAYGQKSQSSSSAKLMGEMVQYKSGDLMIPAYLARANRKEAAAVLVIHEVFGLNDHIKSIADRISREGFNALAPNLFVRAPEPPPSSDSTNVAAIRKAASSIPLDAAIRDMQAGLDYLKTMKDVRKRFASVGFCMGGSFSYQLAANSKDLAGAVIFYGRTPLELVPKVTCPILGNFGEQDQGIPPGTVTEFEEALKKAGKEADIKIYTGAGHGFFNDTRPQAYNAAAAADAWQRTLRFFGERLNS